MQPSEDERVRREQERRDKIAAMQRFLDEGLRSGIGTRTKDEILAAARARFEASRSSGNEPAGGQGQALDGFRHPPVD